MATLLAHITVRPGCESRFEQVARTLYERTHALEPGASTAGHQAFFVGVVLMIVGAIWLVTATVLRALEAIGAALFG